MMKAKTEVITGKKGSILAGPLPFLQKKMFSWGLAYSFRNLVHYHHSLELGTEAVTKRLSLV